MRFQNIIIEGPDCSGKSTLFNEIHKRTGYVYNIQDRSCMSMIVYSKMYNRNIESIWFDKLINELKRLDILYITLIPSEGVILERFKCRGDEVQDEKSILEVRKHYINLCKSSLEHYPNILLLENDDFEENVLKSLEFIHGLNEMPTHELIKSLVFNSGRNELTDIKSTEVVNKSNLDFNVLNFPLKKHYYEEIENKLFNKLFKEFSGLNDIRQSQKHDSRRFVFVGEDNISMIHFLWRQNKLNVSATLRSSNILKTFWADYEFLKILSVKAADEMSLPKNCQIDLTINIRSAYIVE